ncbi:hypothetical protein AVEN_78336-1 [Araneus ventricosus]|uniref:Uncharacterized protein n=1 Tax=Araneus ventricosus TaxID=182803 RepID=A0A4Y2J1G6_ARAVE|nr:hypothetical protein AVEN_78336-1 [Araneus ventricosus]
MFAPKSSDRGNISDHTRPLNDSRINRSSTEAWSPIIQSPVHGSTPPEGGTYITGGDNFTTTIAVSLRKRIHAYLSGGHPFVSSQFPREITLCEVCLLDSISLTEC